MMNSSPGDATGWNIVSHPSVFAEVFHWRHEEDRDRENASNPKVGALGLDDKKKKKGTLGVTEGFRKHQKNTGGKKGRLGFGAKRRKEKNLGLQSSL